MRAWILGAATGGVIGLAVFKTPTAIFACAVLFSLMFFALAQMTGNGNRRRRRADGGWEMDGDSDSSSDSSDSSWGSSDSGSDGGGGDGGGD